MTRISLVALIVMAALTLVIGAGCDSAGTQTISKQIARKCTSVGTDGRLLIGQCAEYDLRYCLDDSMKLVTAWDSCPRIAGLPAPKPAGQPELFTFTLTVTKDRPYWWAIKVRDSLWRWSPISNCVREVYAADPPPAIKTLE